MNAPNTAAPMSTAEYTPDSRPSEMPDRMTVAAPVSEVSATSLTGRRTVSVKYPVNCWMSTASTTPMTTATNAITAGLPVAPETWWASLSNDDGRKVKAAIATPTSDTAAVMKNPRLIGTRPLRSTGPQAW